MENSENVVILMVEKIKPVSAGFLLVREVLQKAISFTNKLFMAREAGKGICQSNFLKEGPVQN